MSLPSRARGIALAWTRVGLEKFSFATAWSNLESKPRVLKLEAGFPALDTLTAVGTSSSLSFRFMTGTLSSYHECGRETLEINSTFEMIGLNTWRQEIAHSWCLLSRRNLRLTTCDAMIQSYFGGNLKRHKTTRAIQIVPRCYLQDCTMQDPPSSLASPKARLCVSNFSFYSMPHLSLC